MSFRGQHPHTIGNRPFWLLDLDVGGQVLHVATEQIDAALEGTSIRYTGGLTVPDVTIGQDLDSIAIEIDDQQTDWALLRARGHRLDRRSALLRLWYTDATGGWKWRTVLQGGVSRPEYGDPDSPTRLVFTLVSSLDQPVDLYPPTTEKVDETTFNLDLSGVGDSLMASIGGQPYPTVIGYPGSATSTGTPPPGSPALQVTGDPSNRGHILISRGTVEATTVQVWELGTEETGSTAGRWKTESHSVSQQTDALGQQYSAVTGYPTGASPTRVGWDKKLYIGWSSTNGGGIVGPDGTAIRGLGDVIDWAVQQSGARYDRGNQREHIPRLNRFKLDTFIAGGRFDMLDWVTSRIGEVFPVRRINGGQGVFFAYVPHTATKADAVAWLDADIGRVRRTSSITARSDFAATRFEIRYRRNPDTGSYAQYRVIGPDHEEGSNRVFGSKICKAARAALGKDIEAPVIETELIWDDATALDVLQHRVVRDALPLEQVQYTGTDLAYIRPYQAIVISDSEVHLDERVALVESVQVGSREQTLTLSLLPGLRSTS